MRKPLDPNHVPGSGRAQRLTARLPPATIAAIEDLAQRRAQTAAAVMRDALDRGLVVLEAEVTQKTA